MDACDTLFVSPPLEYSSATHYTLNLASALPERGERVVVLTSGGRFEEAFRQRGIRVEVQRFLERFPVDWFLLRRLLRELKQAGVRLVHAQSSYTVATGARLARRLEVPLVATIHRYHDPSRSVEIDWRPVGAVITFSAALRTDIVNNRRAPKEIVHVIPAGVGAGPELPPPFPDPRGAGVVGTLGEVERADAQEEFVLAAREVLKVAPDVQFVIVGEGANRERLKELIRSAGFVKNATFANVIDHRKVLPIFDICVMPSLKEGPGHAMLEAMAASRPIIATGEGGAYEILRDEETGLIVEKEDPLKLAQAILRLVSDRELARALGRRARKIVLERFPLDRMLDETLALYGKLSGN